MYVYTPPQGHHTPPIPWGGVGTRDTGPYIYTHHQRMNENTGYTATSSDFDFKFSGFGVLIQGLVSLVF